MEILKQLINRNQYLLMIFIQEQIDNLLFIEKFYEKEKNSSIEKDFATVMDSSVDTNSL